MWVIQIILAMCLLGLSSNIVHQKIGNGDKFMQDLPDSAVNAAYAFMVIGLLGVYATPVLHCRGYSLLSALHLFVLSVGLIVNSIFVLVLKYGYPKDSGSSVKFKDMPSGINTTSWVFIGLCIVDILYIFFFGRRTQYLGEFGFIRNFDPRIVPGQEQIRQKQILEQRRAEAELAAAQASVSE